MNGYIILWVYLAVYVFWIFGTAVRILYKYQEKLDFMYEDRFDVVMGVVLYGALVGIFWPAAVVVFAIMYAANRFLQKYKPRKVPAEK